ncbi:outer membrane protein assembly factor BamA [Candidatus Babeliales bacterium]|nr:outer membrane protein assembly factor BamA [Candidatus Babeliales bacterium]
MISRMSRMFVVSALIAFFCPITTQKVYAHGPSKHATKTYTIKEIIVEGNKTVKQELILNSIPYRVNDVFDAQKSELAINNLYALGHFRKIKLEGEEIDSESMVLIVTVEEKKLLEDLHIKGNKKLETKKIKEKIDSAKITAIDEETLKGICEQIKKMYVEEHKHFVTIETKLTPNEKNPNKMTAELTIHEGPTSSVKFVNFKGNDKIAANRLNKPLFTRENWLLGFMDQAGSYSEEQLDADKHRIEYFYRDHGYLTAKVTKTDVDFSPNKRDVSITFNISEGDLFTVSSVSAHGDEVFSDDELKPYIDIKEGEPFSQSKLIKTIGKLRELWGEKGYIFADVYPQVKPNEDTKEVAIVFNVDRGKQMYVNRIEITGNHATRDKVIRRQLDLVEGEMITSKKLTRSKASVEYLSFFERDGVNWKIHRITDELADLEMNVREAKTGSFNFQMSYGTDRFNPRPSLRGMLVLEKSNLFGLGWEVGGLVQASRRRFQKFELRFIDPYLFDSNISGAFYFYKRWDEYEQWRSLNRSPVQIVTGGHTRFGFRMPQIDKRLQLLLDIGIENIRNKNKITTTDATFAPIVNRSFQEGTLNWLGLDLIKDTRNHQIYPNEGYKLTITTKTALPGLNDEFAFLKGEAHASCYTALIGKDTLVLGTQMRLSAVRSLGGHTKLTPYKELFHMGGQNTIRGHVFGGAGPAWKEAGDTSEGSPLGAQNAFLFSTELIFPLIPDYSMKAHFFYDAGCGWDTPKNDIPDTSYIKRDKFQPRHSVGFGLNLVNPFPAKIDWGFKLDRKKSQNESAHEFHLTMNYAW